MDELRTSALANLAAGDLALLAAAVRSDHPGRAVVYFAIVNVALAVLWGTVGSSGRARRDAKRAPVAHSQAAIEAATVTRRRVLVGLVPIVAVLGVLVGIAPESAAVIAGVPAGIGAADLWTAGWLRSFERARSDLVLREAGASPFSGGSRPVYTRPMAELTDET